MNRRGEREPRLPRPMPQLRELRIGTCSIVRRRPSCDSHEERLVILVAKPGTHVPIWSGWRPRRATPRPLMPVRAFRTCSRQSGPVISFTSVTAQVLVRSLDTVAWSVARRVPFSSDPPLTIRTPTTI